MVKEQLKEIILKELVTKLLMKNSEICVFQDREEQKYICVFKKSEVSAALLNEIIAEVKNMQTKKVVFYFENTTPELVSKIPSNILVKEYGSKAN